MLDIKTAVVAEIHAKPCHEYLWPYAREFCHEARVKPTSPSPYARVITPSGRGADQASLLQNLYSVCRATRNALAIPATMAIKLARLN